MDVLKWAYIPETETGYKLLTKRKNGTLGPLFINKKQIIPIGEWIRAENHLTKKFAYRPGWHICHAPVAPHLSKEGRVWCHVEMDDYYTIQRPEAQGGMWYLSKWMKIINI